MLALVLVGFARAAAASCSEHAVDRREGRRLRRRVARGVEVALGRGRPVPRLAPARVLPARRGGSFVVGMSAAAEELRPVGGDRRPRWPESCSRRPRRARGDRRSAFLQLAGRLRGPVRVFGLRALDRRVGRRRRRLDPGRRRGRHAGRETVDATLLAGRCRRGSTPRSAASMPAVALRRPTASSPTSSLAQLLASENERDPITQPGPARRVRRPLVLVTRRSA